MRLIFYRKYSSSITINRRLGSSSSSTNNETIECHDQNLELFMKPTKNTKNVFFFCIFFLHFLVCVCMEI